MYAGPDVDDAVLLLASAVEAASSAASANDGSPDAGSLTGPPSSDISASSTSLLACAIALRLSCNTYLMRAIDLRHYKLTY